MTAWKDILDMVCLTIFIISTEPIPESSQESPAPSLMDQSGKQAQVK